MPAVFISYRRDDSAPYAGRLYDRLAEEFGPEHVFLDIDTIEPGQDFVRTLKQRLANCDAVLVLIGRKWITPRLHQEGDLVRQEVATALERGIRLIPVLLGGATMPTPDQLPAALARLSRHQALELSDARFQDDATRLVAAIRGRSKFARRAATLSAAALFVAASAGLWFFQRSEVRLRGEPATISSSQALLVAPRAGERGRLAPRLVRDAAVVMDGSTGLMWEKSGSGRPIEGHAIAGYVRSVNAKRPGGFDDWRLPTLEEAMSLLTTRQPDGFHLDPVFDRASAPFVWTSDTHPDRLGWVVYYHDGAPSPEPLMFHAYVRLVRHR